MRSNFLQSEKVRLLSGQVNYFTTPLEEKLSEFEEEKEALIKEIQRLETELSRAIGKGKKSENQEDYEKDLEDKNSNLAKELEAALNKIVKINGEYSEAKKSD